MNDPKTKHIKEKDFSELIQYFKDCLDKNFMITLTPTEGKIILLKIEKLDMLFEKAMSFINESMDKIEEELK
jgi:hypothetical protein